MPSRHETFGVVYAEVFASGKPIIAIHCSGLEFIVNDTNGKLVVMDDVQGFSLVMQKWPPIGIATTHALFETILNNAFPASQWSNNCARFTNK
jgi:glycosyltransferase involved in cell wall biosynthesis